MQEIKQENTITHRPLVDIYDDVKKLFEIEQTPSVMQDLKKSMRNNPFNRTVYECLIECKERTKLSKSMIKDEIKEESDERLNTMLKHEGITGPDISISLSHDVVGNEQEEYRLKLGAVRKTYEDRMSEYTTNRSKFSDEIRSILHMQREFRPITTFEIDVTVDTICERIKKIPQLIKQSACEATIALRKRFFDARRKRRNFSKSSTEILNEYFIKNIDHPYPSEEIKQALAAQCNISVAQVSNWFGNKRIRYKKTMAKEKQVRNKLQENAAVDLMAVNPYAMLPNAFSGVMNPYQMMMPGQQMPLPAFTFPMYNPEMMAHYHQSMQNANQDTS